MKQVHCTINYIIYILVLPYNKQNNFKIKCHLQKCMQLHKKYYAIRSPCSLLKRIISKQKQRKAIMTDSGVLDDSVYLNNSMKKLTKLNMKDEQR